MPIEEKSQDIQQNVELTPDENKAVLGILTRIQGDLLPKQQNQSQTQEMGEEMGAGSVPNPKKEIQPTKEEKTLEKANKEEEKDKETKGFMKTIIDKITGLEKKDEPKEEKDIKKDLERFKKDIEKTINDKFNNLTKTIKDALKE